MNVFFTKSKKKIVKFRLEKLISEVFSEFLYDKSMENYIIKTFCLFLVEGDQSYLMKSEIMFLSQF